MGSLSLLSLGFTIRGGFFSMQKINTGRGAVAYQQGFQRYEKGRYYHISLQRTFMHGVDYKCLDILINTGYRKLNYGASFMAFT